MKLLKRLKTLFKKNIIGIDIGNNSIKIVELEQDKDKGVILNDFAIIDTPGGLIDTERLKDIDDLADKIKMLLLNNNFQASKVVTSVNGGEVVIRTTEVPNIPKEELDEVAKWEAKEQIPLPMNEVILDYEIIDEKLDGGYELMLVAVKEDIINYYLTLFEKLNLEPIAIEIEALAIVRALNLSYPKETIAVVDIGAKTTDISVFTGDCLLFTRNVGLGGENITKDIAETYNLDLLEAEEYKKKYDLFEDLKLRHIIRNLTTAIYRSLDYFQIKYKNYEIKKLVLTGGGSKLLGLDNHLNNEFGIEVEKLNISQEIGIREERLKNRDLSQVNDLLGVSIGLALRGDS